MRTQILTDRSEQPAYFDCTGQFSNSISKNLGLLRIGDRAAAYILCLDWRKKNPNRKLIILDNPHVTHPAITMALPLHAQWMFGDIADEIIYTDFELEQLPSLDAEPIYRISLWNSWYQLRKSRKRFTTNLAPTQDSLTLVKSIIKKWSIPNDFVTIQPLFDAEYNIYRNRPIDFWVELIELVRNTNPVVLLGIKSNATAIPAMDNVFPFWAYNANVMDSLAMISLAKLHIGGETGTTMWSPILQTPTFGVFSNVIYNDWDIQPISFGQAVKIDEGYNAKRIIKMMLTKKNK